MRIKSGKNVAFRLRCPEAGWIDVPSERLLQWSINFEALVATIGRSLGLIGRPTVLIPARLWRIGRTKWDTRSRDVLFSRCISGSDDSEVAARIAQCTRPIIFVGGRIPAGDDAMRDKVALISLADVLTDHTDGFEIDHSAVIAAIQQSDALQQAIRRDRTSPVKQRLAQRRQIKQELKTLLADDAIAESYRLHQSYRKVAVALSSETGRPISKDHVGRAIQRLGGPDKVLAKASSESVTRSVASQHRDRSRKKLIRVQAAEDQ